MKLGLSNFQPVATNEVIEQEALGIGDAEQLTAPMIESDQELASLCWSDGTDAINASETDCVAEAAAATLGQLRSAIQRTNSMWKAEIPTKIPTI